MRADRPPHLGVLDDRAGADEQVDVVGERVPVPNASGTPQRGKLLVKIWVRALCSPESRPSRNGELAEIASSTRQHRAQPVADQHRPVGAAHADVDVQREGVVAPGDVLEPLLDPAVVLGVDDLLLAVVGPRMRAGRPERDAAARPRARTAAGAARAARRAPPARSSPRPERISISEEISSPAIDSRQHRVRGGRVAQLLEAGAEPELPGSSSANSSSSPTVKSVEASKAARAVSRSRSTSGARIR